MHLSIIKKKSISVFTYICWAATVKILSDPKLSILETGQKILTHLNKETFQKDLCIKKAFLSGYFKSSDAVLVHLCFESREHFQSYLSNLLILNKLEKQLWGNNSNV